LNRIYNHRHTLRVQLLERLLNNKKTT
jgi:hypothetical protein